MEKIVILKEYSDELESVINSMTQLQREWFLLFQIKGLMLKEIAELEGIAVPAAHR